MTNLISPEDKSELQDIRELCAAMYIQSMRIYDMLAIMADKLGADAKGLSSLHQQGQVLAPDPALFIEENDQINQNDETN